MFIKRRYTNSPFISPEYDARNSFPNKKIRKLFIKLKKRDYYFHFHWNYDDDAGSLKCVKSDHGKKCVKSTGGKYVGTMIGYDMLSWDVKWFKIHIIDNMIDLYDNRLHDWRGRHVVYEVTEDALRLSVDMFKVRSSSFGYNESIRKKKKEA